MTFARFAAILIVLALIAVIMFLSGLKPRAHHVAVNTAPADGAHHAV